MLCHHNWRQARATFEEILSKHPTSFALAGLAEMYIAENRILKAQECAWEAWRLSPLASSLGGFLCWCVYLGGDLRQVLDLIAQIRSGGGDGGYISTIEALVLIQSGSAAQNLTRLKKTAADYPQSCTLQGILGYAYGAANEIEKAKDKQTHLSHGPAANRKSNGYALAIVSLGMGNHEDAIAALEAASAEGSLWSLGFQSDPILKPLSNNPRFQRLVNKIGISTHFSTGSTFHQLSSRPFLERVMAGENS
jgi:tetratricopeptide (TPR) repeat protein